MYTTLATIQAQRAPVGPPVSTFGTAFTQLTTIASLGYGQNALYVNQFVGGMCCDSTGQYIVLCDQNEGKVFLSQNSGAGWSILTSSNIPNLSGTYGPCGCCCSSSGQYMYIALNNKGMYYNSNYGAGSWTVMNSGNNARTITCSSDGSTLIAQCFAGGIMKSTNYGTSWAKITTLADTVGTKCFTVSMSTDGTKMCTYCTSNTTAAAAQYGVWYSSDSGTTWTNLYASMTLSLNNIKQLDSGNILISTYVGTYGVYLWNGTTWTGILPNTSAYTNTSPIVYAFDATPDGSIILCGNIYTSAYAYLFLSKDSGATFSKVTSMGTATWQNILVSKDGKSLFVTGSGATKSDLFRST